MIEQKRKGDVMGSLLVFLMFMAFTNGESLTDELDCEVRQPFGVYAQEEEDVNPDSSADLNFENIKVNLGMAYENGKFMVPEKGLYYAKVLGTAYHDVGGRSYLEYSLTVGDKRVGFMHMNNNPLAHEIGVTSFLLELEKGEKIGVRRYQASSHSKLVGMSSGNDHSHFIVFRVY